MPRIIREIVFHEDVDFRSAFLNMVALIRDACDRGVISWDRRCEMIDMMDEKDGGGLYESRNYEQSHADPEVMCLSFFIEPSAAFLAEIGASVWQL
ncbi:hypothetical protein MKK88_14135 [Methylobacterium sp. E-005]|uniref:hypothetical protein n=1 Tax=Methylobacterium sp. E-005 TaxID=2836549 RepID=UPI001FBA9ADA|nr:hypothetical protein [Methylobacterium sp. E-005]MCJ2087117.1 hypothetical protein [Methylobacterium sp. E-005]